MKKNIKIGLIAAIAVVIAGSVYINNKNTSKMENKETQQSETETQQLETQQTEEKKSAANWICTAIYGSVKKDMNINLKDDYQAAVNKDVLINQKIKPGSSSVSAFSAIEDQIKERKIEIIQDQTLNSHDAALVKTVYGMADDWEDRNKLGISPVLPYIQAIREIQSMDDLTEFLKNSQLNITNNILGMYVIINDFDHPEDYVVGITSMPLCMNDSAEYSTLTDAGKLKLNMAKETAEYILKRAGLEQKEIEQIFEQNLALETEAAKSIITLEEQSKPDYFQRINNKYTREELAEAYGNYPILDILDARGYGDSKSFLVSEPKYANALNTLYVPENLEKIKSYLISNLARKLVEYLDWDAYVFANDLNNKYYGSEGIKDNDMIAYDYTEQLVSLPLDNLYIAKYTTPEEKEEIIGIIKDTMDFYRVMLQQEDWLSKETKEKAIEKLDHMTIHAVYPDELCDDYSDLNLQSKQEGGSFFETCLKIWEYETQIEKSKINGKADLTKWEQREMTASTVNAFYNPQRNSINILAGILGGTIYYEGITKEELYGCIGTVIGHEISHAFDTNGAQFDKNGSFTNWWTDEDYKKFMERSSKLVNYYHRFIPYPGADYYNGELVQTEVTADLGGLKAMLSIAKSDPDFNYDTFFRKFVSTFTGEYYSNMMPVRILNEHPLDYLRCNIAVQQFQEFYDTYDIQPGDGMYLAPEERINVW